MKKTFCDICDREAKGGRRYIFPYFQTYTATGGKGEVTLMKFDELEDKNLDICEECRNDIAIIIKRLKLKQLVI